MNIEELTLVIHSFVVIVGLWRYSPLLPSNIFMIYTYLSCVIFYVVRYQEQSKSDFIIDGVYYSAMPLTGVESVALEVQLIYLGISLFCILTTLGISGKCQKLNINIPSDLIRKYYSHISVTLTVVILINLLHLLSLNIEILWFNKEYLAIKDPKLIGIDNVLLSMYHFLSRYLGLVIVCYFLISVLEKNRLHILLSAIASFYPALILFAANSRWVVIYILSLIVTILLIGRFKSKKTYVAFLLILGILTFNAVLHGRGSKYQGLSQIIVNFSSFDINVIFYALYSYSVNIFESSFNLANSLKGDYIFNKEYKILSFSPFPSAIDNFASIRDIYKHKFATNVPMGAYGEVISFGILYTLLFFSGLFTFLRKMNKVAISGSSLACIFLLILSLVIAVYLPNYSIRTIWRILILLTLFAYLLDLRVTKNGIFIKVSRAKELV